MKKYKYTGETMTWYGGYTVHRIAALRDFGDVKKGNIGGWIEKEENLSHEGSCWVYDSSKIFGDAEVRDNAQVKEDSFIWDSAQVFDDAIVDHSFVCHNAWVFENAEVSNCSSVRDDAMVYGNAKIDNRRIDGGHHVY